jgi:hypothetical protein
MCLTLDQFGELITCPIQEGDGATHYWMATVKKRGVPVRLFTRTTDEMVEIDLAIPQYGSLIFLGREGALAPQDSLNQFYLASGAIKSHLHYSGQYDGEAYAVTEVAEIPNIQPINSVGGSRNSFLCNIWEELESTNQ